MDQMVKKAKSLALRKKYADAYDLLKQAEANGDAVASYALGTWHLHGLFVPKDTKRAIQYLDKAAKQNLKEALFDLAVCYETGEGIARNFSKAFSYYVKASNLGDKDARFEVVRCLYYGIGVKKDVELSELIYGKLFRTKSMLPKKHITRSARTHQTMVA